MRIKKYAFIICLLIASLLFTGCSTFTREKSDEEDSISNEIKPIKDMKDLESGKYYILHKEEYYPLYVGDASFKTEAGDTNDSRTCWFQDDFELIPTLYLGDKLIYCNDEYIEEKFVFERFEYGGYTIGICNLSKRDSGRYTFNANYDDGANQIAINSNARQLYNLANSVAVIETISGKELPPGNVSRGGFIKGLSENQKYKVQIYIGTQLYNYSLKADSVALTSMDSYTGSDYTFLESRIAEINIPSWFNTGYYMINDGGIFRLVKNKTYTKYTDFNVANIKPDDDSSVPEDESVVEKEEKITSQVSDAKVKRFTLDKEKKIIAKITWTDEDSNVIEAAPTAKIIGDNAAYTFSKVEGVNALSIVKILPPGAYRIIIEGLGNREYEIEIK